MGVNDDPIHNAQISWDDHTPLSKGFGDIYYSPLDGVNESRYVFIEQNNLNARWCEPELEAFCIGETGFGTGLNFLNAAKLWKSTQSGKENLPPLHFLSFEKFPLTATDLEHALHPSDELREFSQELIAHYPKSIQGIHRLHFDSNIHLTLVFGDALKEIKNIEASIDAWFFDGFAPSTNPDLWSQDLFEHCARLSKVNTSFSSFTSAGHVKRKLQACGFEIKKVPGFGKKREMLTGKFIQATKDLKILEHYDKKPWLKKRSNINSPTKRMAVIGAGLAGAWTAFTFAQQGWQVEVFEKENTIAPGASGNPRGATYFKPNSNEPDYSDFYLRAYLYATYRYRHLFPDNNKVWDPSGLLQLASSDDEQQMKNLASSEKYSQICSWLSAKEASEKVGMDVSEGLFYPDAGSLDPRALCKTLLTHPNIKTHLNQSVDILEFNEKTQDWSIHSKGTKPNTYPYVVIANSYFAKELDLCQHLPLNTVRGQTTLLRANQSSKALKSVVCSKGYLSPSFNGGHCIGSTFDPRNNDSAVLDGDNLSNLSYLEKYVPSFYSLLLQQQTHKLSTPEIISAKAAFRCQSPDLFPIVGQLPRHDSFLTDYADIAKGQLKKEYPLGDYWPGLYVNLAHAARGLISTPLSAELLLSEITQGPLALSLSAYKGLSPARFYMRALRKNKA